MPWRNCKPRSSKRLPSPKPDFARFESSSQLPLEVDCNVSEVVSRRLGFQARPKQRTLFFRRSRKTIVLFAPDGLGRPSYGFSRCT
ncbi:hypothetical protein RBSH_03297 [Rhodopirellula baltica SH28]|uniref:Uncharacterized protein n=1 Tax=Rhodopirellula baltica SH28 TaxID=993517 RepID=K5DEY5_RHOBT|nr:hypothetical protein RBSH_03297 [Rhodopirellula baltica SH28]